ILSPRSRNNRVLAPISISPGVMTLIPVPSCTSCLGVSTLGFCANTVAALAASFIQCLKWSRVPAHIGEFRFLFSPGRKVPNEWSQQQCQKRKRKDSKVCWAINRPPRNREAQEGNCHFPWRERCGNQTNRP